MLFSIVIPTYNRADLLKRAMGSVLEQTWSDWELIVIDDASTDDTPAVLAACCDPRVRSLRNDPNRERSASRNRGIEAAEGEYICFLDSDDLYLPRHLETLAQAIAAAPEKRAMFFTQFQRNHPDRQEPVLYPPVGANPVEYVIRNQVATPTTCFHSSLLKRDRFDTSLKINEDVELFARIVGALNDGLAVAGGEFVARMDSDDLATPDRFAKQLAAMQQDRECVALGSAVLFTDPKGRPLKAYRPPVDHAAIEEELARGNGGALIHPTVLFRRAALIQCGGYRQQYNFIEDLDLYVRLLAVGRLANLPDVLLHYRQHANSVNHLKGSRSVQAAEIIAPLRQIKRLPPLTPEQLAKDAPKLTRLDDCYRKWALDAAEGQNFQSAWANAVQAVRRNPLEKANWSCLRYLYGCKRAAKTVTPK